MKNNWLGTMLLVALLGGCQSLSEATSKCDEAGKKSDGASKACDVAGKKCDDAGQKCEGAGKKCEDAGNMGSTQAGADWGFIWRSCQNDGDCTSAKFTGAPYNYSTTCAATTATCGISDHVCRATLRTGKQCYKDATRASTTMCRKADGTETSVSCSSACNWDACP